MSSLRKIRADAQKRAVTAYSARLAGGTWSEVASVAGYATEKGARRAVQRVFENTPAPDIEHQRILLRDRADALYRLALKDAHDRRPGAIAAAVRVLEMLARIDGLNAPTKLSLIDPTQEQIDEYLDKFMPERHEIEADFFDDEFAEAEIIEKN